MKARYDIRNIDIFRDKLRKAKFEIPEYDGRVQLPNNSRLSFIYDKIPPIGYIEDSSLIMLNIGSLGLAEYHKKIARMARIHNAKEFAIQMLNKIEWR